MQGVARLEPAQIDQIQQALARSAAELTTPVGSSGDVPLSSRLEQLTRAALDSVPGADYVGLTMRTRQGGLESHAPTGPELAELDRLQVSLDEGPFLDAIAVGTSSLIEVIDFADEAGRWPRFAPAAADQGVASLLSFAMAPDGAVPGAINFFSRTRDGFDAVAKVIAGAFAMQAGIAVYGAREVVNLQNALSSRDVIGQAKGILMERHRVDAEKAFSLLVHASQDTNMKLFDVARWLSDEVAGPVDTRHDRG